MAIQSCFLCHTLWMLGLVLCKSYPHWISINPKQAAFFHKETKKRFRNAQTFYKTVLSNLIYQKTSNITIWVPIYPLLSFPKCQHFILLEYNYWNQKVYIVTMLLTIYRLVFKYCLLSCGPDSNLGSLIAFACLISPFFSNLG